MDDHTKFSEEELDEMAVDFLATSMRIKLAISRDKGRAGWRHCRPDYLSQLLREHVEKGDPVDVANFCAFLVSLRSKITPDPRRVPSFAPHPKTPTRPSADEWRDVAEHLLNVANRLMPTSTLAWEDQEELVKVLRSVRAMLASGK